MNEYENLKAGGDSKQRGDKDSRSPQAKRGTAAHKWDRDEAVQWAYDDDKSSQPDPFRHLKANDGRETGWPA